MMGLQWRHQAVNETVRSVNSMACRYASDSISSGISDEAVSLGVYFDHNWRSNMGQQGNESRQKIPRVWGERELSSMLLPLAHAATIPEQVSADFYNRCV